MSPRFHKAQALTGLVVVLSLILPTFTPLQAQSPTAVTEAVSLLAPPPTDGVFRARVTFPNLPARDHLTRLGVVVLDEGPDWATVLVDGEQLEALARLRFEPQGIDELGGLVEANSRAVPWLADSLEPLLAQAATVQELSSTSDSVRSTAVSGLRATMQTLTPEEQTGITSLSSVDDDADGLTNTQEQWWCTDPLNPDSDGDGASDGEEVADLKAWIGNELPGPPAYGKPFVGWPPDHAGCYDDDQDSIPDLAERWELGLNMNRESTDRDKFDDGQELFGNTYCPGSGGYCGYGALPRNEDWGIIFAEMPSWVESPGDHPFVAAFPIPEIDVVESSLHVETVTVVTTDHTISEGEEHSYTTSSMNGTSVGTTETETWNDWMEVSTYEYADSTALSTRDGSRVSGPLLLLTVLEQVISMGSGIKELIHKDEDRTLQDWLGFAIRPGDDNCIILEEDLGIEPEDLDGLQIEGGLNIICDSGLLSSENCVSGDGFVTPGNSNELSESWEFETLNPDIFEQDQLSIGSDGSLLVNGEDPTTRETEICFGQSQSFNVHMPQPVIEVPRIDRVVASGNSLGGSYSTSHTEYEEHTVTNGEAFSTQESWGTATAVDSAHAADLWFTYQVHNNGTEYAREICDLAFNIYIGDDPNPAYTYFVGPDVGGDGCFNSFMPGEEHEYTSRRIPLTLEQMKAIDLGSSVRIVVEDYSYGIDELFYQDAINAGSLIAVEDGADDGDESIDTYLIPTWGTETVLDVLARYFPHETDAYGNVIAIWTPEYIADTPSWCVEPRAIGAGSQRTLFCKHALSTADWWNVYLDGLGDGTQGFQDTPASPGSVALFRFNKDSDLDGYSDRSELRFDTDPNDPASYPQPELIAGMHSIQSGNDVVSTLSLLNTGLYDAYGVESVMISPNDSISVTNNTVGGSGRVRALNSVIVGSRVMPPSHDLSTWQGSAQPFSAGYYTGDQDRIYSFTALHTGDVSTDTLDIQWDDGQGNNGTLNIGNGYASPTPLDVGSLGVQVGFLSGDIQAGDTFTIAARTPRDTFRYTINSEPAVDPVVLVSYNDPQGNHRFVTPVTMTHPADDLIVHSGEMLEGLGVEIVTDEPVTTTGTYTTSVVVNWPVGVTLEHAHLFLEFVNISGTVAAEIPMTVTLPPGPSVVPMTWSTDVFSPTFQPDEDYIVMAFWTDWQGNIIDTGGRPLSSFQADPRPAFAMAETDATWNFGTAAQGTVLRRAFTFANTGHLDLLTFVDPPAGVSLSQQGSQRVGPADVATYEMTLNTAELPVGAYDEQITVRSSDPDSPTQTVHVTGTITTGTPDTPPGSMVRPLDWDAYISGSHSQGEWVEFTHSFGPEPQTLHPVTVYNQDYGTLWGVGRYATAFGGETPSYDMFGDGSDGDLTVSSGQTFYVDNVRTQVSSTSSAGQRNVYVATTSGFGVGDEVLIVQMQGVAGGSYEFGVIAMV